MVLYLVNALITPFRGAEAIFRERRITIQEAKEIVKQETPVSAIGHESTAQLLSQILGITVQPNRIQVFLEPGDQALAFVLRSRPPEGKILTQQELEQIGYELVLVERVS